MTECRVNKLRSISIGAPNAPAALKFYQEIWGLKSVAEDADGVYLRGTGPEHYLLSLHQRPSHCLVRIDMGAADRKTVDRLFANCQAKGVRTFASPTIMASPGGGYGFDLVDLEGRIIRVTAERQLQSDNGDSLRPRKLSHLVLNTTHFEAGQAFYRDILGFRLSDLSEDTIAFLRCNTDHHSIALHRNRHSSVNHIAFDMTDIDAVMRGVGRMKTNGYPLKWGVGRHGPGNNVFAYFTDPNSFVIEYTCFLDEIDERDYIPRVWQRVPDQMDRWGTAGPPSDEIRAAMAGVPDAGFGR